jgi:hypothetical protein
VSAGGPGGPAWSAEDDTCWREAARLRQEHPNWIIIWLASARQYRAYCRLPGARRDTILTAPTPDELAAKITEVEQSSVPGLRDGNNKP